MYSHNFYMNGIFYMNQMVYLLFLLLKMLYSYRLMKRSKINLKNQERMNNEFWV